MKVSLQWLKEFVKVEIPARELAHKLTHAGLEVESIQVIEKIPPTVLVVQIEKIEKHPQADRLSLCDVSLGSEKHLIVCGAKNMKVGDRVALAQPGTILPDGKKIERSKIRGIESAGMLCSEVELGLFEESSGLMILPPHLELGKALSEQMDLEDVIFEVNVTPNRSDCLSIYGIAREVAALLGQSLKPLEIDLPSPQFSLEGKLRVEVQDQDLCPRYTARMLRSVRVQASPFEVRLRLQRLGLRSINNVVDATNYVMMEMGQPLHAFDASKISGSQLQIRKAKPGEKIKTLDSVDRSLETSDLVISDEKQVLAIAGVMGGEGSAVNESTQDLILESAFFDPKTVRKSSRRLALQSESSYRFERGVDPNAARLASDRLASLILKWAGGELSREVLDTASKPFNCKEVTLRKGRLNQILGVQWSDVEIEKALSALAFKPKQTEPGVWLCEVPAYRHDISREIDLIEEVARLIGYEKIQATLPKGFMRVAQDQFESSLEESIRTFLAQEGFLEVVHYSFAGEKDFKEFKSEQDFIRLANPLSEDLAVMRPALLPSMLSCLRHNIARQNENLKLFELRNIYRQTQDSKIIESKSLVIAMSGERNGRSWNLPKEKVDFYDLKGLLEKIMEFYKLPSYELKLSSSSFFHPGASATLIVNGRKIGDFGQLHPQCLEAYDLRVPVMMGEFDLGALAAFVGSKAKFQEIPKFPGIDRDLTVVAPDSLLSREVVDCVFSLKIPLLKKMECVDVYTGEPIEKGKKALTYSLIYLDAEKTLTDLEVNQAHDEVMNHLKKVLPVTI